jgi:hypothetical protein
VSSLYWLDAPAAVLLAGVGALMLDDSRQD